MLYKSGILVILLCVPDIGHLALYTHHIFGRFMKLYFTIILNNGDPITLYYAEDGV